MRISVDNRFGSGAGWPPALQVQETIEDVAAILGRHLGTSVQLPDELHVLPGSPRTHTCAGTLPAKIEVGSEDAFAIIHQAPHEMGHVVANIWKLPCWNVTKNHWFEEAVCGALPALVYAEIGAGAAFRHVVTQASAHNASDRYLSWVDGHAAKYGSPSVSWSQAENWFLSRQIQIEANPTFDMAAPLSRAIATELVARPSAIQCLAVRNESQFPASDYKDHLAEWRSRCVTSKIDFTLVEKLIATLC